MKPWDLIDPARAGSARSERSPAPPAYVRVGCLAIACVSVVVYSNALLNGFVYDDMYQVVDNLWLRDLRYVPEVFSSGVWGFAGAEQSNYYRPLMHLSYMLTYALFGLSAWAFHLVNVLLHAGVSVLVFLTGLRLHQGAGSAAPLPLALLAALLFATHPVHTEAVTWVAGLPEVSFSLFFLLSFYLYVRATPGEQPLRRWPYLLSVAAFFVAAFSKETALTLPIVLAAYDLSLERERFRVVRQLKRYLPYAIMAGVYLAIRTYALGGFASMSRHTDLSRYEYVINVLPLIGQYLGKLLLPWNLNAFYGFDPIHSLLEARGIASLAVTSAYGLFLAWSYARHRLAFFSASFILVPLLPVLYIPALGENTFTERYLYLPSFGFVLLASCAVGWVARARPSLGRPVVAVLLVVACVYSAGTLERNTVWRDDLRLWSDTVEKSPDSVMPHSELGIAYATRGETDKAVEQYRIALRMNPDFADGYSNLALVYRDLGMLDESIRLQERAVQLKPDSPEAHNNLGLSLSREGRLSEAIGHYRTALRLEPRLPGVHNNLGNAYQSLGMLDEAIEEYREALRLRSDFPDAYLNLGVAYAKKGRIEEAIEQFREAERLSPDNPVVHHNLANAYALRGLHEQAEAHRREAERLQAASAR